MTGQAVGGIWWAVSPDGTKIAAAARRRRPLPRRRPGTDADEDPGGRRARGEPARRSTTAHAPVLLAYALRLTDGDRGRAEDIVQETLLRAWRNLDRLDERRRPVRPWLFTVAQRLAIDAHRARRARPPEVGDAALVSVPALDQVDGTLDRIIIADALNALSRSTAR